MKKKEWEKTVIIKCRRQEKWRKKCRRKLAKKKNGRQNWRKQMAPKEYGSLGMNFDEGKNDKYGALRIIA